jgi:hypothetical protein
VLALDQMNRFLSMDLTLQDLQAVYDGPLHRRARGLPDLLLASAIHAKNYAERIDGRRSAPAVGA